jgi:hypothetical protein
MDQNRARPQSSVVKGGESRSIEDQRAVDGESWPACFAPAAKKHR